MEKIGFKGLGHYREAYDHPIGECFDRGSDSKISL